MRSALLFTSLMMMTLLAAGCQTGVNVTTPTDPPVTGSVSGTSTPAPTSANTVMPTPARSAIADTTRQPAWLKERIRKILAEEPTNPPVQVFRYLYNDQVVYYETAPCCDFFTTLYAADGKIICQPDGGITGKGDGKCSDFLQKRSRERLIWQDPR
ncbi:hypothetical protein GCM10011375_10720 [Hymenobacter qilianensis]|uniref:Uncharacterized protein n=2 Tax=Hymenobacter qilianensis TaxID=1385715 RepID=A0ACB5PNU9_9BACT|nr:hypothetical protein [Hymenobacter qilianensis]QNP53344.1 hypothetical protein H9L05_06955 [Hymenobacter qilianensis]GGF57429.1 hypothetical protein GCM10011375_10720 [Hymenobacter qilianensis]